MPLSQGLGAVQLTAHIDGRGRDIWSPAPQSGARCSLAHSSYARQGERYLVMANVTANSKGPSSSSVINLRLIINTPAVQYCVFYDLKNAVVCFQPQFGCWKYVHLWYAFVYVPCIA